MNRISFQSFARRRSLRLAALAAVALGVAALGAGVLSAAAPPAADAPTYDPGATTPMPTAYDNLLYRSIFTNVRARPPVGEADREAQRRMEEAMRNRRSTTGPTTFSSTGEPVFAAESVLALEGVADQDGQFVGFVEDQSSGRTTLLKDGDLIAHGRVKKITLDGLQYESKTGVQRVAVGQTFDGQAAAAPAPLPVASAPAYAGPGPGENPGGGGPDNGGGRSGRRERDGGGGGGYRQPAAAPAAAPAAPSANEADVIERMRRRRQEGR